ncbi:hypothetical protein F2Q68_00003314 [Brassica cretica]|uniref:Uncharacterized protein n=1 Tax=Brassica cretica TaxID=69181 RepID=A0A8S9JAB7_BRACR|nr:hypothetical protein F2Q68_00003314 [Brassica cretica]
MVVLVLSSFVVSQRSTGHRRLKPPLATTNSAADHHVQASSDPLLCSSPVRLVVASRIAVADRRGAPSKINDGDF